MAYWILGSLALLPMAEPQEQQRPPNVVVILSDDQGWGDLSLNGNSNLETPNIDQLAKAGAQFERFFVCPVCSPTRAEFLTGRYHPRGNVFSTSAGGERLDLDEMTIAETFKAAGYATAAFGKWHNGMQYPYHPNGRGFDEYYGFCSGHWGNYYSPMLEHNGKIVKGNGFLIDDFTDHAIDFMQQHREQPFFVYLPFNTPHAPMQVPDKWWDRFKNKEIAMRHREPKKESPPFTRAALAMCENIDYNVGRITKKLADLDLADDTIIVYFNDNGPNSSRWNGDMKGRKGSTDEGGVRSPLIIRWPAGIEAGQTIKPIGAAIDLLPTLAELADIKIASKKPLDGLSLAGALTGGTAPPKDRLIFSHWKSRVSVRSQDFRLDHTGKLFELAKDPGQRTDVSAQYSKVAKQLKQAVNDWKRDVMSELAPGDRPFLLGSTEYRYTQLPARDATATGDIKRSNRWPNCSFFTNWTNINEQIQWPVEVAAAGNYRVELYYTCPKKDVGSKIELSVGDSKIRSTITVAHDPPLTGAENDRVPRPESYVKDWQVMDLGEITLAEGNGDLVLRATDMPGSQVMDFRLLMFTRVDE